VNSSKPFANCFSPKCVCRRAPSVFFNRAVRLKHQIGQCLFGAEHFAVPQEPFLPRSSYFGIDSHRCRGNPCAICESCADLSLFAIAAHHAFPLEAISRIACAIPARMREACFLCTRTRCRACETLPNNVLQEKIMSHSIGYSHFGASHRPKLRPIPSSAGRTCPFWCDVMDTPWSKAMRDHIVAAGLVCGPGVRRAWRFYSRTYRGT
jgi:hypothetical protein